MEKKAKKKTPAVKKSAVKAEKAEKPAAKTGTARHRYFFAVGRRKTAIAKVKVTREGSGKFVVNDRELGNYFPGESLRKIATDPLTMSGLEKKTDVVVAAHGGGIVAQARAVSLGVSRALLASDPEMKPTLRKQGFLTRDARKKERKKPGLKRARRAPQWQKR